MTCANGHMAERRMFSGKSRCVECVVQSRRRRYRRYWGKPEVRDRTNAKRRERRRQAREQSVGW